MRQIEKNMVSTIKAQRHDVELSVKGGITVPRLVKGFDNTRIETGQREDGAIVTSVYLHNNLIAQNSGKGWGFKLCGWNTPTTKSRINALASANGLHGVHQKKGVLYCNKTKINAMDWFHPETR